MGKVALWRIPADHFGTLRNNKSGRVSLGDVFFQVVVPIGAGLLACVGGAALRDVSGAVAGISIVAGLLFSMAVFLFQLRLGLKEDRRLGEDDYRLVDECMKNTLWAILWGLSLALYLVVGDAGGWLDQPDLGPKLTGVAVSGSLHFLFVIAMCLKRLRRAYERLAMRQE